MNVEASYQMHALPKTVHNSKDAAVIGWDDWIDGIKALEALEIGQTTYDSCGSGWTRIK